MPFAAVYQSARTWLDAGDHSGEILSCITETVLQEPTLQSISTNLSYRDRNLMRTVVISMGERLRISQ